MRNSIKIIAMLLAMLLLCGCNGNAAEPTQTEATQPTAPLLAEVATQEELVKALAESPRITLVADMQLTNMVGVKDRILDGGGHTITGPELQQVEVENAEGKKEMQNVVETENAVMICSGTVENLTIKGAYRCLGDSKDFPMIGDVRIKNVTADGQTLAMAFGRGGKNGALYVENCILRGWVLINGIQDARFENCTFGFNSEGKNGYFRPYRDVTLTNCKFENLVDENGKVTKYNISFYKTTDGLMIVLEDCYVGDTLITQENLKTLLKVNDSKNKVVVRNSTN